ncbi:MAG: T9SS type A sorting domain-containing protein [Bacteroidetes bacterium]|nr:T9SS type A sorting domain-containing protein [Bacteroidota bacterium]
MERREAFRLKVSPNPTQGLTNIDLNGYNNRSYALNITDLTGKILFTKTIEQNISKTIVDLSFLDNGCYIISLNDENGKVFSRNKVVLLK